MKLLFEEGGGLRVFLQQNKNAEVFLQRYAFDKYFSLRSKDELKYIGLEEELKRSRQIILTSDRFFINKGIHVFSNIIQREPLPKSHSGLLMEEKGQTVQDTFVHEQNLVIEEDGKMLLVTGCAHNGIVNIIKHLYDLKGRMPNYVIGGFHLSSRSSGSNEALETIDRISKYLIDANAKYYTCHCTGIAPYNRLKAVMGSRIEYLSAGSVITI